MKAAAFKGMESFCAKLETSISKAEWQCQLVLIGAGLSQIEIRQTPNVQAESVRVHVAPFRHGTLRFLKSQFWRLETPKP